MSIREEPRSFRNQEHCRRIPVGESAEVRRDRRQRRRHSVLPLSRSNAARPGIRLRAARQQRVRIGGESPRQLRFSPGCLRRGDIHFARGQRISHSAARSRASDRDTRGNCGIDRRVRRYEWLRVPLIVARDRLRLPAGRGKLRSRRAGSGDRQFAGHADHAEHRLAGRHPHLRRRRTLDGRRSAPEAGGRAA